MEEDGEDVLLEVHIWSSRESLECNFCDNKSLIELGTEKGREGEEMDWC